MTNKTEPVVEFQIPLSAKVMVDEMRQIWARAPQEYEKARKAEVTYHEEFLRLYHILERMPALSGSEGYKIAARLREVLILRRQAKWDMLTWGWIHDFTHGYQMAFHKMAAKVERQNESSIEYIRDGLGEDEESKELA